MENAAKALGIAGGVLIALVIAASLLYTFNRMSQIPEQQNYSKELEQLTEFNEQFEAYQKKLMYGVDVISCLNKVLDNNQKSQDYMDRLYNIDIYITMKTPVEDKIEVYYLKNEISQKEFLLKNKTIGKYNTIFDIGDISQDKITKIRATDEVKTEDRTSRMIAGTYNSIDNIDILKQLSEDTTDLKRQVNNPDRTKYTEWSKVIWYTSAYNFKNKKFRCTSITYDNEGRVNSISFEELEKVT